MAKTNPEAVTAFGEVLRSANVSGPYNHQNNRMPANDNRKSSNGSFHYWLKLMY